MNGYGDPGADPVEEWRVARLTDMITPASLRAHADWIGNGPLPAAEHLRREADRLEAEAARDEYVEKLAKAIWIGGPRSVAYLWERLSESSKGFYRIQARAALDFLAADGRLLPEGGTVLTAEQVAEARELLDAVDLDAEEFHLLRAAFTPPAAPVPDSRVHNHGPAEGRGLDCPERMVDGQLRGVCMDSGPDGTPEKPWPTWQDVPEGVKYRSSDGCYCFVNRNGSRFPAARASESTIRSSFSDVVMGTLAPFVRVDGDKA